MTKEGHKTLPMTLEVGWQRDRTNIEEETLVQRKGGKTAPTPKVGAPELVNVTDVQEAVGTCSAS